MKSFDLFSGYGGFAIAAERNGIETIGFSEIDKYASMVLKYRFPNVKNYGDIKEINTNELPDFDLLCGGSPCQDLSIAGKRKGLGGERSGLFAEYVRILNDKRPRYFIWENVKGAMSSNKGFDFALVLNSFSEAGYSLWWQVLNAKDFGVPQNRERIFIIGFREGSPREVFFERENSHGFNEQTKELPEQFTNCLRTNYSNGRSNETYIEQLRPSLQYSSGGSGHLSRTDGLTYTVDTGNTNAVEIPTRHPLKFLERNQKNIEGDYAFCLDSANTGGVKQGTRIRRLTPKECERLMSLEDDWTRYGIDPKGNQVEISDSQRYKLCGNGVVVNVVDFLIREMTRH